MTKIALVTGGTRGIGASVSISLKNAGYNVAATYNSNTEKANAFASEHGI
jgi:acetoacetyl-CoA reductase